MSALQHLDLAPRGSGGLAAGGPAAPDLLAELENIKTPPAAGDRKTFDSSGTNEPVQSRSPTRLCRCPTSWQSVISRRRLSQVTLPHLAGFGSSLQHKANNAKSFPEASSAGLLLISAATPLVTVHHETLSERNSCFLTLSC